MYGVLCLVIRTVNDRGVEALKGREHSAEGGAPLQLRAILGLQRRPQ